jgi:hypothetical protein
MGLAVTPRLPPRSGKYAGLWAFWLALFLVIEIIAARSKQAGKTLSETLRRWFPTWWSRVLFSLFLVILLGHLWFGWSVWYVGMLGAYVVGQIGWTERTSIVGLKDKAAKWLALRWFKGVVKDAAKDPKGTAAKAWRAIDGWKLFIVTILNTAKSFCVGRSCGGSWWSYLDQGYRLVGWNPDMQIWDPVQSALAIGTIVAMGSKAFKAYQQKKAGATFSETGSTVGYVKAALADGTLPLIVNKALEEEAVKAGA